MIISNNSITNSLNQKFDPNALKSTLWSWVIITTCNGTHTCLVINYNINPTTCSINQPTWISSNLQNPKSTLSYIQHLYFFLLFCNSMLGNETLKPIFLSILLDTIKMFNFFFFVLICLTLFLFKLHYTRCMQWMPVR